MKLTGFLKEQALYITLEQHVEGTVVNLEVLLYIVAPIAAAITVLIALYVTRTRRNSEEPILPPTKRLEATEKWRSRVHRSISYDDAKEAGNELRTLSLEREILSSAIRRLYEAHAEGQISEKEREQLAEDYKARMMKVKKAVSEKEAVVALHELEVMQDDLTKLFNERFDKLNAKIDDLRSQIGLEIQETFVPAQSLPQIELEPFEKAAEKKPRKRTSRKPAKTRKTAAEEKIEKIQAEVEKVLNRLEQMEAEA